MHKPSRAGMARMHGNGWPGADRSALPANSPVRDNTSRLAVVIPAMNERDRIAGVIQASLASRLVSRVVAVVNGSTDGTAAVAEAAGAEVLVLNSPGKGEAMLAGVALLDRSFNAVVFLDADLVGLEPHHVDMLASAVVFGKSDMVCGILAGRLWHLRTPGLWPLTSFWTLTGQRAIRRELLDGFHVRDVKGYRMEAALNRRCASESRRVMRLPLDNVRHVRKEEKETSSGIPGRLAKYRMIATVYITYGRLVGRQVMKRPLHSPLD